jgi:chitodextrinase
MRSAVLLLVPAVFACSEATSQDPYGAIQRVFDRRCAGAACHVRSQRPPLGLDLTADLSYRNLVGVPAGGAPDRLLVTPGAPGRSYLMCKLDPGCEPIEGDRMPPEEALEPPLLDLIRTWIRAGAPPSPGYDGGVRDREPPRFAGLASAAFAGEGRIRLAWDPGSDDQTPERDLRYRVYWAPVPDARVFAAPLRTVQGVTSTEIGGFGANLTFYFVVRAVDASGNEDGNVVERAVFTRDTTPPTFSGIEALAALGPSALRASWQPASDVLDPSAVRYRVYVGADSGEAKFTSPPAVTVTGATEATVTGLAEATAYFVSVRAVDEAGNEDANTVERSARTADVTPPAFAGVGAVEAVAGGALDVSWPPARDNADAPPEIRYRVYVATSPRAQDFARPTAESAPGETRLRVSGLQDATPYHVVVRAVDRSGNEDANTVERSVVTRDGLPPLFAGAAGATAGPSSVTLAWSPATDNVTPPSEIVYLVYSAQAPGAQNFSAPSYVTPPGATSYSVGSLRVSTTYYFVVRARDRDGNVDGNSVQVQATTPPQADRRAPTFAGAETAAAEGPSAIRVGWSAAADDVTPAAQISYLVYAASSSGGQSFGGTPQVVTLPGALSATVSGLAASTSYYFVVRARDAAGNVDGNVREVSARTLGDSLPPVFSGASSATALSDGEVSLSWSAASDDTTLPEGIAYLVYQAASSGAQSFASPSFTTAAGATSYRVSGLSPATAYYYVVRARDAAGNVDANLREVSATTLADATPPAFAGLSAAAPEPEGSVLLSWAAATDNVTPSAQIVYLVFQASSPGGQNFGSPTLVTAPGATSQRVTGLQPGATYYFVVRARDAAGNVDTNSVERSAGTSRDEVPPTYAGLSSAAAAGFDAVTLSWTAATDNVTPAEQIVYLIYQAATPGGQSFSTPAYTTAPGATSYRVGGLAAGTTYYFVARARDQAGNTDGNTVERSVTTPTVSFSRDIVVAIFVPSCAASGCHSGARPARNLNLATVDQAYTGLVNVASEQCPQVKRVAPGAPDSSYLLWKLAGSGPCFSGSQMPKAGTSLTSAEISAIRSWILQGAPRN